jgi:hypothetical protein
MADTGKDIFGYKRGGKPRGVLSSSEAVLTISGAVSEGKGTDIDAVGALIQGWQVDYQQSINELFELGSDEVYWVKGRPQGQGSIDRVVGFKSLKFFSDAAYDVCQGGDTVMITANPGACFARVAGESTASVALTLGGTIVTALGFGSAVQDTLVRQKVGFKFSSLRV